MLVFNFNNNIIMKKNLLTCLFIINCHFLFATEISVPTQLKAVTIYLSGASLESVAKANIPAGVSTIRLTNIASGYNDQSIQVEGLGNFTINSVTPAIGLETPKIDSLKKRYNSLNEQILASSRSINAIEDAIKVLDVNKNIKGANSNLTTNELNQMVDFYQKKLMTLNENKAKEVTKKGELQEKYKKVLEELSNARTNNNDVLVTVSATKAQTITLGLSYFIYNAHWTPFYEVRVADVNKDISVAYKAKVDQSSGIDWNNVKVTLSTGNPTLNGTVPTLSKWILREQPQYRSVNKVGYAQTKSFAVADEEMEEMADANYVAPQKAKYASMITEEKMTSIEFTIDELFSVKSQQDDAMLTINTNKIPAEYVYRCVPKLDKNAYLVAKITDFAKYNFLSGDATLYLAGKYVGTSYFNFTQTTDTLQLSLGQDKGIVVERTLSDDFYKKSTIGKNYKQTVTYSISARNNKSTAVKLELQDNIPVSGSSNIEVSFNITDGATLNEQNIATWKLDLQPAETKKVNLSYTVIYPKTMSLNLK